MTAPTTSAYTSTVLNSGMINIDALLGGDKWGYALNGSSNPLTISYSFPWINGLSAVFSSPNGGLYSRYGEENAAQHFGFNSTQQNAASLALSAWSNVANINFQLISETSTNVGDIRFAFSSASSLSEVWGYAGYPSRYWPSGGDVWINEKYGSDLDWTVGATNFESLMHEIGHALGLKHPFEDGILLSSNLDNTINTIMSYTDIKNVYPNYGYENGKYNWLTYYVDRETPMVLDIAAIQYIYGPNNNFKTGDDVYTFDPIKPFYKTIWDAGGNDTISVSNFSLACVVDLTPGNYSSLLYPRPSDAGGVTVTYNGINNLGIAYNCIIENAVGGLGNDKLIGNNVNNSLDGGSGNDIIYGGAGNDNFDWSSEKRWGNDTFYGGLGDDNFVLDSIGDTVIEYSSEGDDTIWVDFNYSITSLINIENLFGYGKNNLNLIGNSSDNTLRGSSGNDYINGGDGNDTLLVFASIEDYYVTKTITGYSISNRTLSDGVDNLFNIEAIKFSDKTINLSVQAKAASTPQADVIHLVEFYVSFFNRIPDADGMNFWIDEMKTGKTINQVADSFYNAGLNYTSLTGFSFSMSNTDFIDIIYKNVLGRKNGADAGGLTYWDGVLTSGQATRGALVNAILNSAHTFKGNAIWGWVADLLDNKITVAKKFSIDLGLNYNTPEESITHGMAIASAITSTDTTTAIALIGVTEENFHLS